MEAGASVEGVEEFRYLSSKQSSTGYTVVQTGCEWLDLLV